MSNFQENNCRLIKYIYKELNAPKADVYHFTKPENILKIKETEELLMQSHDILNEKDINNREGIIALELILRHMKQSGKDDLAIEFKELIEERKVVFFTTSFCNNNCKYVKEKYGGDSLQINLYDITNWVQLNNTRPLLFSNVIYSSIRQKKIVSDILSMYNRTPYSQDSRDSLIQAFLILIPLFKENTLENVKENESRLVTYQLERNDGIKLPSEIKNFKMTTIRLNHGR